MKQYTTTQEKCYTHFTSDEREEIATGLLKANLYRTLPQILAEPPPRLAGRSGEIPLHSGMSDTGETESSNEHGNVPATATTKGGWQTRSSGRAYVESHLVNDSWLLNRSPGGSHRQPGTVGQL